MGWEGFERVGLVEDMQRAGGRGRCGRRRSGGLQVTVDSDLWEKLDIEDRLEEVERAEGGRENSWAGAPGTTAAAHADMPL